MTKKNEKRSFVFYNSFLDGMKHLDDSEFRECVMKIRNYALDGDETESEHPMVNIILAMAKPNLDAARRRYMASVENGRKGAEYGKLGGAPKGNQNARKNKPQLTPKQPLNVDVEEDVNDNEDVDAVADEALALRDSSTFSISSLSNDSERFEEREEKKEPLQEVYHSQSNDFMVGIASKVKGETPIYSKCDSDDSATNPSLREEAGSSATQQIDEVAERKFCAYVRELASDKLKDLPRNNYIFKLATDSCCAAYDISPQMAVECIEESMDAYIKEGIV